MSSNLRANISLTTNILLVLGTFLLVLKITPIAKDASMEHLCTEFNHLRFNRTNDAIPGNFDAEANPELVKLQNKRVKRRIYLDKKITRLINLPYYTSKKEIDVDSSNWGTFPFPGVLGWEGEAKEFCEFFNTEFFNIRKKQNTLSY